MGLTKIAITRPVFVFVMMILAFLAGKISYDSMRVEQNPDVSFGVVTVTTVYAGATPEAVEFFTTNDPSLIIHRPTNRRQNFSHLSEGFAPALFL